MVDITPIHDFLPCVTPDKWVEDALARPAIMLIDHANCELKAAQTAQSLIWKYGTIAAASAEPVDGVDGRKKQSIQLLARLHDTIDQSDLLNKMSKLAREELRHFEQVIAIMKKRGLAYSQLSSARYAGGLREGMRHSEPERLVDILIIGALIEARSCERFAKLAPHLDEELRSFYLSLLKSESRHFMDYLKLAKKYAGQPIDDRIAHFCALEKDLVERPDSEFRFHSGPLNS